MGGPYFLAIKEIKVESIVCTVLLYLCFTDIHGNLDRWQFNLSYAKLTLSKRLQCIVQHGNASDSGFGSYSPG